MRLAEDPPTPQAHAHSGGPPSQAHAAAEGHLWRSPTGSPLISDQVLTSCTYPDHTPALLPHHIWLAQT